MNLEFWNSVTCYENLKFTFDSFPDNDVHFLDLKILDYDIESKIKSSTA